MTNTLERFEEKWQDQPQYLFLLALAINATALVLSHNYLDGDAHTRTFMALQWLKHPFFIYLPNDVTWVFAPLHCYLNAAVLAVWNNPPLAPRILSLVLTSLTIFPLYYSVRMVYGVRAAFYTALFCSFCTLFIHPAAIAVSEGINVFFIFSAIYFFLRYRDTTTWRDLMLSALAALAATAMRYDSGPLTAMMAVLLFVNVFTDRRSGTNYSRANAMVKASVFALVSHAFAIMWMLAQWIKLGSPTIMMSEHLELREINQQIAESGRLFLTGYHLAFLPAVMFITAPVAFVAGTFGFWRTVKARTFNLFFWLLAAFVVYYLLTFVFSLSRYPLARFTTLGVVLWLCFAGAGLAYFVDRLSSGLRRIVMLLLVGITVVTPIGLSFFSHPSDNPIAEKLRAVSPLTNPPAYFAETSGYCKTILAQGERLVLDTRNYNDRLLYIDLYRYSKQINYFWPDNDSFAQYVRQVVPEHVLYTDYPANNHGVFTRSDKGDSALIAGVPYLRERTFGIYTLYRLSKSTLTTR